MTTTSTTRAAHRAAINADIVREGIAAQISDGSAPRLTPSEWAEAVERAALVHHAEGSDDSPHPTVLKSLYRPIADAMLRAAFPHLAPEDTSR